ncbi:hypothetical protein DAETH_32160 [Deinococcus aetherius]|uniref:Uncharacterized protein n=1 Tax=Deinococcus aetherius TaxID=200252 RepID=A0ABN6RIQ8_9DEIO|nr:hypothetical protein DAETH_32160 [Deinococcus aetherius]
MRLKGTVVFLPFTSAGHWACTVMSSGAVGAGRAGGAGAGAGAEGGAGAGWGAAAGTAGVGVGSAGTGTGAGAGAGTGTGGGVGAETGATGRGSAGMSMLVCADAPPSSTLTRTAALRRAALLEKEGIARSISRSLPRNVTAG